MPTPVSLRPSAALWREQVPENTHPKREAAACFPTPSTTTDGLKSFWTLQLKVGLKRLCVLLQFVAAAF